MPQLTKRATKDLERLPPRLQDKAKEIVRRLDDEPALGKKLLGQLEGKRSARLGRSHRIVYTAVEGRVIVLTIAPRRDAYK